VLRPGQTHLVRYEILDGSGVESTEYERGFRFPAGQYALQVRFDAACLPVACFRYARRDVGVGGAEEVELTLTGHHSVHVSVGPVVPGVVGIRWEWG
jgi:hypothetical protein